MFLQRGHMPILYPPKIPQGGNKIFPQIANTHARLHAFLNSMVPPADGTTSTTTSVPFIFFKPFGVTGYDKVARAMVTPKVAPGTFVALMRKLRQLTPWGGFATLMPL